MTATKKATTASARKLPRAARRTLAPLSVAHLEEATRLLGKLVDTEQDVFIEAAQKHRERHRIGTERPLTAQESAQIASAMVQAAGLPPVALAVAVQESELRGYEHPSPQELLLAGGAATAPGFIAAVKRFVALVEMTRDDLRMHSEEGDIDAELDRRADTMRYDDLEDMRARTQFAADHFAKAAGVGSGKVLALLTRAAWQMIERATTTLGLRSEPSSLTGSPPNTDGLASTSSTQPATQTP
jgi:hypothetical protein